MLRTILFVGTLFYLTCATLGQSMANDRDKQKKYLERFNHLGAYNPDPLMAALRATNPDEEFKMAVRSFQRFAGLAMTGVVDNATVTMMETPRCGVVDLQNNMGSATRRRRKRYTVQGQKWSQTVLTYKIRNHMQQHVTMTPERVKSVLQRAFATWAEHIPITFTENTGNTLSDIEISFGKLSHGDNSPFDGPGQTLAHAYFPGLGIGGDMHFDDDESFTENTPDGTNLLQVAIHELGHSLGLGHSDNQDALMAPFYRKYIPENVLKLHIDDITGIKYLYPGSKKPDAPSTARPSTIRPPPAQVDSVSRFCLKASIDAIDTINGVIHAFYGDKYLQLEENGTVRAGFPKLIGEGFPGVPDNLDAVLSLQHLGGPVYFFKDSWFWLYNRSRPDDIRRSSIQTGIGYNLERIDAAFVWGGDGYAYFVKGNQYYRYSLSRKYLFQPRNLAEWKNLPPTVDDAFQHPTTRKTYFFSGTKYYIVQDMTFSVQLGGDIYDWVHCCSIRYQDVVARLLKYEAPDRLDSSTSSLTSSLSFTTVLAGLFSVVCGRVLFHRRG